MGLFNKNDKTGGFMDEIRCDEPSYLIWKWHPSGSELGTNNREDAIRWGSSLRVKNGEVAVFVYKQPNGAVEDYIVGPYDGILKTENLPIIASIISFAYEGGTPFPAEVYFINLAKIIQIQFAVPFFDVYDPIHEEFSIPTAVRGTISFKIDDYKEFIKLHRLIDFNLENFQNQIRDVVSHYAKDTVSNAPRTNNIPLIQIERKITTINEKLESDIRERLKKDFGVIVTGVDISAIELDKSSEGYEQLLSITKDVTTATIKAETEARLKNIAEKQAIEMRNYEENLRIQREEEQYARHKQTQSNYMGAFQVEKQTEVGIAGAEALGKMGANGAGNINLGSGESGFNPAAMMAGMAVGGAVGQNIAGTMNGIMNNTSNNVTPPPIPTIKYYVADNGQQTGPFDKETLKKMVEEGKLKKETLVWKDGMSEWKKAESVDELKDIFPNIPPIPTQE